MHPSKAPKRTHLSSSGAKAAQEDQAGAWPAPYPLKITVTTSSDLDESCKFWHHGGDKLVYCPDSVVMKLRDRLGGLAEVAGVRETVDFGRMLGKRRRSWRSGRFRSPCPRKRTARSHPRAAG
jgi:hypothetical protein